MYYDVLCYIMMYFDVITLMYFVGLSMFIMYFGLI